MRDSPSRTAEIVCFMRAADAREPEAKRILSDRFAELFLSPPSKAALATWGVVGSINRWAGDLSLGMGAFVLARHRFIDEALVSAVLRGEVQQVVLLGAGYDTRAYRFRSDLEAVRIFEVDHPATGRRKRRVLAEHTSQLPDPENLTRVEIDFRVDSLPDRLSQAGFDIARPTFFVWEGVSMYLSREQVESTLRTLHELAAPGSALAMDFWFLLEGQTAYYSVLHRAAVRVLSFLGEPVTFSLPPKDAPAMLERLGWKATDLATAKELEARWLHNGRKASPGNYVLAATRS